LIHYYLEPQEFELYDLVNDPGERENLYGKPQQAALQQDLRDRMEKLRKEIPEKRLPAQASSAPASQASSL
jgi:hypothetical protein